MVKISVITACYNSQSTIRDAIESVVSQDWPNVEYIVSAHKLAPTFGYQDCPH
ncbi:glycosyltransferase [Marinobacter shengliensis]